MSPDALTPFEQVCTDIFERYAPLNKLAGLVKNPLLLHEYVHRYDTEQSGMRNETQCKRAQNSRKCGICGGSDSDMMAPHGGEIE